ncbi:CotH kinase family protein [Emticicia agri]|nr:CotH kinase family protein [Emticicia agri]
MNRPINLSLSTFFILILSISSHCFSQSIFINEVMASNHASVEDNTGNHSDWIELYNPGNNAVDLSGYYMSDNPDNPTKFRFTTTSRAVVVPARGYLIIWASGNTHAGARHTSFALSASGESISISNADGKVIDSFSFNGQRRDVSYGRLPDGGNTLSYFSPATPGAANNPANAYTELLAPPVFSRSGGFFDNTFALTITHADPGVSIYYTIDGSTPIKDTAFVKFPYKNSYPQFAGDSSGSLLYDKPDKSNLYKLPITIADRTFQKNVISNISSTFDKYPGYFPDSSLYKGTVIRAIAVKQGALPSEVVTNSYFYSADGANKFTFPVVSLAVQNDYLFNYYTGIYVAGYTFEKMIDAGGNDFCTGNYGDRGEAWERAGNFELIVGASSVLSKTVGVRINGACTRAFRSKSLRLYGDTPFDYPIFSESPQLFHDNLLLRNSGQDFGFTMFKDAFYQRLVNHFRMDTQASQPSVVFINGEYWGLLNIRERFDNNYIETVYGVNKDSLDMLEISGVLIADKGTTEDYDSLMIYLQNDKISDSTIINPPDSTIINPPDSTIVNPPDSTIVNPPDSTNVSPTDTLLRLIPVVDATLSMRQRSPIVADTIDYEYVKTKVDIDNLIDYQIAQIFTANTDWPQNNQAMWRKRTTRYRPDAPYGHDGRWRWMLFDTDFGLGGAQPPTHNTLELAAIDSAGNLVFHKLLQKVSFANSFINRFADMLNTTFLPVRTTTILETFKQKYAPEITAHINRWKYIESYANWESNINIIQDYLLERPYYQRSHIREKFDIEGDYLLTVDVSDTTQGLVKVNSIHITPATPGITDNPYPWTGSYFQDIPLTITPIARTGYKFKHWEYNNTILTDSILTITTSTDQSYKAVFESNFLSANPTPVAALLTKPCGYIFKEWNPSAQAGSFPPNMKFVFMKDADPKVNAVFDDITTGAYNLTSKTRINGLGDLGFSFINTNSDPPNPGYPNTKLGGAILAINTEKQSKITLSWTGRTITANPRKYRIRLQYRIGDIMPFKDLLNENNEPIEYVSAATGHSRTFTHTLPETLLNQPYVQLLWKYYHFSGESSTRDQLAIDDIVVEPELSLSGNVNPETMFSEHKASRISSAKNISNARQIRYQATRSILLNPGFKVSNNVFVAQIQSCL